MKYIMVVPDGLTDLRIKKHNNKTPLDAARIPSIDFLLHHGLVGVVKTIPNNRDPGSDVANLSLMGINTNVTYPGRGALEALAQNIKIKKNETAFRANFVTIIDNKMKDYTGGNIKSPDARVLITLLNKHFNHSVRFYAGVDYRNIAIVKKKCLRIKTEPPHNILDKNINPYLPCGRDGSLITEIVLQSHHILKKAAYTRKKQLKVSHIWLWGQGSYIKGQPSFYKKFKLKGAVISAVDIIKSIAKLLKMHVIKVPGITGDFYTNYANKAQYALSHLKKYDFIYIHIEATDEAGHKGDFREKVQAIQKIDHQIIKSLLEDKQKFNIIFVPDHPTPVKYRTHINQKLPFIVYSKTKPLKPNHNFNHYSEQILKNPPCSIDKGYQFIEKIIKLVNKK